MAKFQDSVLSTEGAQANRLATAGSDQVRVVGQMAKNKKQ